MIHVVNPIILSPPSAPSGFTNTHQIIWNGSTQRGETTKRFGNNSAVGGFSGWVTFDDLGGSSNSAMIFGLHGDPSDAEDFCYFRKNGDELQCIIKENDVAILNCSTTDANFSIGTQYHVFIQMTTGGIEIYVNGSSKSLSFTQGNGTTQYTWFDLINTAAGSWNGDSLAYVGGFRNNASNINWFDGKCDEFAFFDDKLSGAEITAIYNSGTPDDLDGHDHLVEWYRFDNDGTDDNTTNDLSITDGTSYETL